MLPTLNYRACRFACCMAVRGDRCATLLLESYFSQVPRPEKGTSLASECSDRCTVRIATMQRGVPSGQGMGASRSEPMLSEYCKYVDNATAVLFQKLPKRGTHLSSPNAGLDKHYRTLWMRRATDVDACFVSAPWHDITEIEWRAHKLSKKLQTIASLWAHGLDWRRRHFIALNQCSRAQINEALRDATGSGHFDLYHANLTIFDSRLEGLAAAATLNHPPQPPNVIPIPLFHSSWAENRRTLARACHAALGMRRARPTDLVFRGSCLPVVHDGRQKLVDNLTGTTQLNTSARSSTLRLDLECAKGSFQSFASLVCNSTWTLVPSGSFPPTFMMYEAMVGGSLPLFAYFSSWGAARFPSSRATSEKGRFSPTNRWVLSRLTKKQLALPLASLTMEQIDRHMPFYDEGVRFSEFGAVLLSPDAASVLSVIEDTREQLPARQRRLREVLPYFSPNGTFAYILRCMALEARSAEYGGSVLRTPDYSSRPYSSTPA